jgi:uncharacterized protein YkwD
VIRAAAFAAIERSTAVLAALAVQIVAVAVVGDVFAAAPPSLGAPPPTYVARAVPVARSERLLSFETTGELADEPLPAPTAAAEPAMEAAPGPTPEATPDPAPEATPEPPPAPTAAPAERSTPAPAAIITSPATSQAELRMLALMNATRLQGGLVPLALDAGVSDAARRHSSVEARYRYVFHDGPDGTAGSRNVPACGTGWYGENTGKVWSGGVDVLHREFMAEPWEPINHRTNIMDPNFRRAGIGAVQGPDAVYITVVFCR